MVAAAAAEATLLSGGLRHKFLMDRLSMRLGWDSRSGILCEQGDLEIPSSAAQRHHSLGGQDLTAMSASLRFSPGWTWVSLNVEAVDMSVNAIFGGLPLSTEDLIKNQFSFTNFYEGYGFFGQLTSVNTDEMYAVKLARGPSTLSLSGVPTTLPKSITLGAGW